MSILDGVMISDQEVQETQGTRLQNKAPWESYQASFEEKLDPKLEAEIADYATRRHEKTSNQNHEEYCRQHEINEGLSKQYQWLHPSEYADHGPRIGKIMTHGEFIKILREKCKVRCWYRQHPQPDKLTLVVSDRHTDVFHSEEPHFVCWVAYGFMPEYSIMNFDRYGVPLAERFRGWRTPILQMILQGVITEEQANKHFGKASGPASDRFLKTCYGIRNEMKRDL
jgi:hypothetical protein